MWMNVTPARWANSSVARWLTVPTPGDANWNFPPACRISAISSATECAGSDGCATSTDEADRRKVAARIVADVREEVRPAGQVRRIGEQQRVAVGRTLRDLPRADRAGGAAAAVLDHDGLPERRAHPVGDGARHDVVGPAG